MSSCSPRSEVQIAVLEAAWALIERDGPAAVRLLDVAREAGVSRQAVYLNFGSRVGLLVALVEYIDAKWAMRERPAWRDAETGEEMLDAFLDWWAGYLPRIQKVANALLAERARDEAAEAAWQSRMDALHRSARLIVDRLAKDGVLAEAWRPAEAADWLWGLVSVQLHEAMRERGWSHKRYADRLRRVVRAALFS